jgi:hypothetical protein
MQIAYGIGLFVITYRSLLSGFLDFLVAVEIPVFLFGASKRRIKLTSFHHIIIGESYVLFGLAFYGFLDVLVFFLCLLITSLLHCFRQRALTTIYANDFTNGLSFFFFPLNVGSCVPFFILCAWRVSVTLLMKVEIPTGPFSG